MFADGYAQLTTDGSSWSGWNQSGVSDRRGADLSFYFFGNDNSTQSLPTGKLIVPDTLRIASIPGTVRLQWTSQNADSATIDNGIGAVQIPNGYIDKPIYNSTTYTLTLYGSSGRTTYVKRVIVLTGQLPTGTFTVTPDTLQTIPDMVTLQWTSENATQVAISPMIGTLNETSGSKTVTVTSNTVFECTLIGPLGLTTTYVDTVIVLSPAAGVKLIGAAPLDYTLRQNYPNPFNPTTMIEYALPHAGFTTLKIYNALGELVSTLVSGYLRPGRYAVEWDASTCASGMYFYRLQTGTFTATKKLVLIR
jgi:hypothetical protein